MSDDTPRTAEQEHIAETWGEGFVRLADHPRIEFGGADIKVTLWTPIKIGGEDSQMLSIKEPTLDQLQKLDRIPGEMAKTRELLKQAGKLTEKEAGAVGMRDLGIFGMILEAFTETARATGA